jgi:hypothetical protein
MAVELASGGNRTIYTEAVIRHDGEKWYLVVPDAKVDGKKLKIHFGDDAIGRDRQKKLKALAKELPRDNKGRPYFRLGMFRDTKCKTVHQDGESVRVRVLVNGLHLTAPRTRAGLHISFGPTTRKAHGALKALLVEHKRWDVEL